MTYAEFKANYPVGSSVASPEGTFRGQCVSYVRQYMALVHGIQTAPLGNAIDFATNSTFLSHYEKVATPQVGDIMVWGDDPGTWTGQYGHIAIFDGSGYMMNQNFNGSLKVSRNPIFTPGFIGYYRKKGQSEDMNANNYIVQALAEGGLGRTAAGDTNLQNNIGLPVEKVIDTFRTYPEWKERQRKADDYDRLAKELADLKSQTSASEAVTVLEPGKYLVEG